MPKQAKGRILELRYIRRVTELIAKRKKRTKSRGRTPWKKFFAAGVGATIRTEIPRSSIQSIVYTYGVAKGRRFKCSYEEQEDGCTLVKIEAVKRR